MEVEKLLKLSPANYAKYKHVIQQTDAKPEFQEKNTGIDGTGTGTVPRPMLVGGGVGTAPSHLMNGGAGDEGGENGNAALYYESPTITNVAITSTGGGTNNTMVISGNTGGASFVTLEEQAKAVSAIGFISDGGTNGYSMSNISERMNVIPGLSGAAGYTNAGNQNLETKGQPGILANAPADPVGGTGFIGHYDYEVSVVHGRNSSS